MALGPWMLIGTGIFVLTAPVFGNYSEYRRKLAAIAEFYRTQTEAIRDEYRTHDEEYFFPDYYRELIPELKQFDDPTMPHEIVFGDNLRVVMNEDRTESFPIPAYITYTAQVIGPIQPPNNKYYFIIRQLRRKRRSRDFLLMRVYPDENEAYDDFVSFSIAPIVFSQIVRDIYSVEKKTEAVRLLFREENLAKRCCAETSYWTWTENSSQYDVVKNARMYATDIQLQLYSGQIITIPGKLKCKIQYKANGMIIPITNEYIQGDTKYTWMKILDNYNAQIGEDLYYFEWQIRW